MVKFTSALLVASLVAAPVFASSDWDNLDARELSEQHVFQARDVAEIPENIFTREVEELYTRINDELVSRGIDIQNQEQLVARSKIGRKIGNFFKKVWRGVKKVASVVLRREDSSEEIVSRDLSDVEEFDARDLEEVFQRFIEEIDERSPGFADYMTESPEAREFEESPVELAERGLLTEHIEELAERDIEDTEIFERGEADNGYEFFEREFDDVLEEREFDDMLEEREFEIDELD